ncbi:MAG: hypothetical protein CVU18_11435 [Betaproteobacteria bacterium HGW-Betaproteobacteria-12]|nr:MAG: hypothetical protein CVU18_11435 [Betaproteobacteria bacterium HGW-Betaproteobacteria-12]
MKRRHLYVLLFGVPALLASIIVSLALFAAAAGVLWLFVLGDNPWPASASDLLVTLLIFVCVTSWVSLMSIAYFFGKKQEANAVLNTKHVMASAGATALLVALVALHQWSVGNIGPKSSGLVCAEFCQGKGFAGSSMPPADGRAATCSCLDAHGQEAVKVTMEEIAVERRQ